METIKKPVIDWAVTTFMLPGESLSGDRHVVLPYPNGLLVGAVDGLGHGHEASAAADLAVTTIAKHAGESVVSLFQHCHARLRGTRGVVMSLALFNEAEGIITWMGVGNVEGVILRAGTTVSSQREALLLRSGVVGGRLPLLSASIIPVTRGDTLIFSTDGIRSGFADGLSTGDRPQQIADRILAQHSKGSDDALVLVARYDS